MISAHGQDTKKSVPDSLERAAASASEDTSGLNAMFRLASAIQYSDPERCCSLSKKALLISEKLDYMPGRAKAMAFLGGYYYTVADYNRARMYLLDAEKLYRSLNRNRGLRDVLTQLANICERRSDYDKAMNYHLQSMKLAETDHDTSGMAVSYGNLASVYYDKGDLKKSLEFNERSIELFEKIHNKRGIANCYGNMSISMVILGDIKKSLEYQQKCLDIHTETGDKTGIANALVNMGGIYNYTGRPAEAIVYFEKAMEAYKKLNSTFGVAQTLGNIAENYKIKGDYPNAIRYAKEAIDMASKEKFTSAERHGYTVLAAVYEKMGEGMKALEAYKKDIALRDTLVNKEKNDAVLKMEMQYSFDNEQAILKAEQEKKDAVAEKDRQRQAVIRNAFIGGFALVLALGLLTFRGYRQKQRTNLVLEEKNNIIESKNKDITDSIVYAKRIQEAVFPDKEIKYRLFPDAFVLFQPRDVVSGDFYWFGEHEGKRIIAAVDCTGHGVPGAFMSLIGNTYLNEIVYEKGITQPAQILGELRERVIQSLKQSSAADATKDGMDIALLVFDDKEGVVEFAGANNPLWVVRTNDKQSFDKLRTGQATNYELTEYPADKRPIGYYLGKGLPFTNHRVEVSKGDALYIFTDGYADQFGGPRGKKMKYKGMEQVLLSNQHYPMKEQETIFLSYFNEWKGPLEQLDDVLVIGIRV